MDIPFTTLVVVILGCLIGFPLAIVGFAGITTLPVYVFLQFRLNKRIPLGKCFYYSYKGWAKLGQVSSVGLLLMAFVSQFHGFPDAIEIYMIPIFAGTFIICRVMDKQSAHFINYIPRLIYFAGLVGSIITLFWSLSFFNMLEWRYGQLFVVLIAIFYAYTVAFCLKLIKNVWFSNKWVFLLAGFFAVNFVVQIITFGNRWDIPIVIQMAVFWLFFWIYSVFFLRADKWIRHFVYDKLGLSLPVDEKASSSGSEIVPRPRKEKPMPEVVRETVKPIKPTVSVEPVKKPVKVETVKTERSSGKSDVAKELEQYRQFKNMTEKRISKLQVQLDTELGRVKSTDFAIKKMTDERITRLKVELADCKTKLEKYKAKISSLEAILSG